MAEDYTLNASYAGLVGVQAYHYADCVAATVASARLDAKFGFVIGQARTSQYSITKAGIEFDLSSLPQDWYVTGAKLRLYGKIDYTITDFDVTVVESTFANPIEYTDMQAFDNVAFGAINTGDCVVDAWNEITLNSPGLAWLNEQTDVAKIGLRSSRELSQDPPAPGLYEERYVFYGYDSGSGIPQLVLTLSDYPNDRYLTIPQFPPVGDVSSGTYAMWKSYVEDITADLKRITIGSGHINLTESGAEIGFSGTAAKIDFDDTNQCARVSSLGGTYDINGALVCDDLETTTATLEGLFVTGDMDIDGYGYNQVKSKITDNEIAFSEVASVTIVTDRANLWQDSADGDFKVTLNVSGVDKIAILADFSEM